LGEFKTQGRQNISDEWGSKVFAANGSGHENPGKSQAGGF